VVLVGDPDGVDLVLVGTLALAGVGAGTLVGVGTVLSIEVASDAMVDMEMETSTMEEEVLPTTMYTTEEALP
jgi:hypothetical protein